MACTVPPYGQFPPKHATASNAKLLRDVGVLCLVCVLPLLVISCAHRVFPVTSGSHALPERGKPIAKRVVVWSNHVIAGNHVIALAQQVGLVVVERARLQQIFDEQKIRLTHSPDDDTHILSVGKLIGADRVIFVELTEKSNMLSRAYVDQSSGFARSETVYHVSLALRCVDVETGEVRWSGTAQFPQAITNPDQAAVILADVAAARALCPVESGYQWKERTGQNQDAYCMKDGKQVNLIEHKQAILPLL